jgi:UDP-N-acetylglucosamine--N-acetylmuramyl-(pentapeptide) pyrophosphoryl-undecaprenol N-acetylglucosamine transferase
LDDRTQPVRIIVAGGGTGGHLFPALAIAEALRRLEPACEILFCGADRGIESEQVPKRGFPLVTLPVRGLRRGRIWENLRVPADFLRSVVLAIRSLRRFRPDVVLGTGGYSSAPAVVAAMLSGVPFVLQEQNSWPGLVTRRLSRWAREVYLSFEDSLRHLRGPSRAVVMGNPVRFQSRKLSRAEARSIFGLPPEGPVVLVFGGSQGARRINEVLLEALPSLLAETNASWLWATGPRHVEGIRQRLDAMPKASERVYVLPFIDHMEAAYCACDLAVCRSGATTLAELAVMGVPSLLIPFPFAAEDHQSRNAQTMAAKGAAVVIRENELTPTRLTATLVELLNQPDRLRQMARAASELARPRAAEEIARRILAVARERKA